MLVSYSAVDDIAVDELVCDVISAQSAFDALKLEWDALVDQIPGSSFFQRWAWLDTWLEAYSFLVDELFIIVVHHPDGPWVAAAPLYFKACDGGPGDRELRFLGTGEDPAEEVLSVYPDILAIDEYKEPAVYAIASKLQGRKNGFSAFRVEYVLADSLLMTRLLPVLDEKRFHPTSHRGSMRYRIELPGSWEGYLDSIRPSMKRQIRYRLRRALRAGELRLEVVRKREELRDSILELQELHTNRWSTVGQPGVFSRERYNYFFKLALQRLCKDGYLRIERLLLNDITIGVNVLIEHGETLYCYQYGFDLPRYSTLSPGVLMLSNAIEQGINRGFRFFDLMTDSGESYKRRYCPHPTSLHNAVVFPPGITGSLKVRGERFKRMLRPEQG